MSDKKLFEPLVSSSSPAKGKKSNYRWLICLFLFISTLIIYFDRQILSLTYHDVLAPEFDWTDSTYGWITGLFSVFYAVSMFFAGRIIDKLETLWGYVTAIALWIFGAIIHSFIGIFTLALVSGHWEWNFLENQKLLQETTSPKKRTDSQILFISARFILAMGESGNFPAAIRAVGEYFPKKDRGFATAVFNTGATIGALLAPLIIPPLTTHAGWETCFLTISGIGVVWIACWFFVYKKPDQNKRMNKLELEYINQDKGIINNKSRIPFFKCLTFRQTWQFVFGKFMTDGIWWFFLFWTPNYISDVFGKTMKETQVPVAIVYAITTLAIPLGYLPTFFVDKKNMDPYDGRMISLLIFACIPLIAIILLVAALQLPLLKDNLWIPVVLVGVVGTAHQSWSANLFSTIGDMFPKNAIATVTGIGGMAGGIGSFIVNMGSGALFDYARDHNMKLMSFVGVSSGYCVIFIISAFAYLIAWAVMKLLVPEFDPIPDIVETEVTEQIESDMYIEGSVHH